MIRMVMLVVNTPPPRDASKAEDFDGQLKRAGVELVEGALAKGSTLGSDQIFAKGSGKGGGNNGEGPKARKRLRDTNVSKPGLLATPGVEVVLVGGVQAVLPQILNKLFKQINKGMGGELWQSLACLWSPLWFSVEPDADAFDKGEEFEPRHAGIQLVNNLPPKRGKQVPEYAKVVLLVVVLMWSGGDRLEDEDPSLVAVAVSEGTRQGHLGDGWGATVGAGVVGTDGFEVVVGVEHSDKKFLNAQAQRHVSIVPVVTPLENGVDNSAVLFYTLFGGSVGLPVAMHLIHSTSAGLYISKLRMTLDLRKTQGVSVFRYDKFKC